VGKEARLTLAFYGKANSFQPGKEGTSGGSLSEEAKGEERRKKKREKESPLLTVKGKSGSRHF